MKIIFFGDNNGTLGILIPSPKQKIEDVIKKDLPLNARFTIADATDPIYDFSFFSAYEFDQEIGAKVNIDKAKEIWFNHYRTARTPLLAALDVDFMRAVEASNTDLQKEIATKKQALRDVTKTKLPDTLEGIKNIWPEILGKNPFNS